MDIHYVVDVHAELQPRSLVRKDPRREQSLAIWMHRLVEEYPWRSVQLTDDYAFGAVDDERPLFGHQWKLAEKDRLLDHIFNWVFFTFLVSGYQSQNRSQWCGESHSALSAFFLTVTRITDGIVHVFKGVDAVGIAYREDASEYQMEASVFPLVRW